MRKIRWLGLTMATCTMLLAGAAQAQGTDTSSGPRARADVRAERDIFLKTHTWDEIVGHWVLKSGEKPPEGVKSREEIRAERDKFLSTNRWNDVASQWEPIKSGPRDISKLSRAEMRKETQAFMRTHQWDEVQGAYAERAERKARAKKN